MQPSHVSAAEANPQGALVALMPKLISLLNAQLRPNRVWQPEHPAHPRVIGT